MWHETLKTVEPALQTPPPPADSPPVHIAKTILFRAVELPLRFVTAVALFIGLATFVAVFVEPADKLWRFSIALSLVFFGAAGAWLTDWLLDALCLRLFDERYGVQIFRRRKQEAEGRLQQIRMLAMHRTQLDDDDHGREDEQREMRL